VVDRGRGLCSVWSFQRMSVPKWGPGFLRLEGGRRESSDIRLGPGNQKEC
jgi:hypothetical protein